MDWLTFVVEMSKSLAWPVASVLIAVLFREQIAALLARMKKGKVGPAEFEFDEAVLALEQEFKPNSEVAKTSSSSPEFAPRASTEADPRTVILEAWLKVETAARKLGKKHGAEHEQLPNDTGLTIRLLRMKGVVDWEHEKLFRQLRVLRNSAVHEDEFKPLADSVVAYRSLAESLEKHFRELAGEA